MSRKRNKPLIRCKNCTEGPEKIGRDVKFMLCSTCRSELDFVFTGSTVSFRIVGIFVNESLAQYRSGDARKKTGADTRNIAAKVECQRTPGYCP